jgi:hypothetical protein
VNVLLGGACKVGVGAEMFCKMDVVVVFTL